jgi:hypothetical protein
MADPKGYVPKNRNATVVAELPAEYEQYRRTKPSDTLTAVPQAFEPKKREPIESMKPRVLRMVTAAKDRVPREDKIEKAAEIANVLIAETRDRLKKAEIRGIAEEFKEQIEEPLEDGSPNPLGAYVEEQKAFEETGSKKEGHYATDLAVYMPSTRKAFYPFIAESYAKVFQLSRIKAALDPEACDKLAKSGVDKVELFLYQNFVKEYIRQSSPYRGMLVYHGLGSGKTCSSIAAAEAIYGVANKKIIVMTPQSLRNNYIKEVQNCGFRHFSLRNHWTKLPLLTRSTETGYLVDTPNYLNQLYGLSVLSLRREYIDNLIKIAKSFPLVQINAYIWVPDFTKPPNFDELLPSERDLVKAQLNETINSRMMFLNYNGLSNAELKGMCCDGTVFDNAVIVIDEIHNLIRLMQGDIEPFLIKRPGKERKIPAEIVKPGVWKPNLCAEGETRTYTRGYMFYRLLVGAKNSKIVGLSGTPIINFPEELGILSNVLAGYIDCFQVRLRTPSNEARDKFLALANKDPRIDFVHSDFENATYKIRMSLFQEGYIKVLKEGSNEFEGVKYSSEPEAQLGVKEVYERIKAQASALGITVELAPMTNEPGSEFASFPRLPPDADTFRKEFIDTKTLEIREENEPVLKKRLSGIISYYKGSKADFFPKVTTDELVECDLSPHAVQVYMKEREKEIQKESSKDKARDGLDNLYAAVEAFSKASNPSSYRIWSRAACNFAFPDAIPRPYPRSRKKITEEVEAVKEEDAVGEAEPLEEASEVGSEPESDADKVAVELARAAAEDLKKDKAAAAAAASEDKTILEGVGEEVALPDDEGDADSEDAVVQGVAASAALSAKPYRQQVADAVGKLDQERDRYMKLDGDLQKYSTKLFEILTRMQEAKGPVLVYSQYISVEGLGVLGIALKANGYDEIRYNPFAYGQPVTFTPESVESFKKGPGTKRFIVFSGGEDQRQRAITIDLFNGQWSKLPGGIRKVFDDTGLYDTKAEKPQYLHGEIISCIGITSAGAEGISLRNVRQVHIMEPYWNMVRLEQVKGRAVRICSHSDLPLAEREVDIYTYVSRFSAEQISNKDLGAGAGISRAIQSADGTLDPETKVLKIYTSDQKVYNVSARKEKINEKLLHLMKVVAVDCEANQPDNLGPDNEPLTCFKTEVTPGGNPFMFDPILDEDMRTTKTERKTEPAAAPATVSEFEARSTMRVAEKKAAPPPKKVATAKVIQIGERNCILGPFDEQGNVKLYDAADEAMKTPIGQAMRTSGRPIPGTNISIGRIRFY